MTTAIWEQLKDPFERLCKQFMEATEDDANDELINDGSGAAGESKYGKAAADSDEDEDEDEDDNDDDGDDAEEYNHHAL